MRTKALRNVRINKNNNGIYKSNFVASILDAAREKPDSSFISTSAFLAVLQNIDTIK